MATSGSTADWASSGSLIRAIPGEIFGTSRLVAPRLGQRPFHAMVLGAYHERCAVTGAKIRPVLEAAHVRPVSEGGENRLDNGLLLRSDVHTLFDRGYIGLDSQWRLLVSPRLRDEFSNGDEFYSRCGEVLANLPDRRIDRPATQFLEWHSDEVFMAS